MVPAHETFGGTFPFRPHFSRVNGFRMHYVDEGQGEPIICLHGEPTWGYLYRNFIPPLSQTHRVIVPDHMGFGKSETPTDKPYHFKTHVQNLIGLVEELDLENITFVAQDWGGPIVGSFALRHPERIKRLCLMNTMLGFGKAVRDKVAKEESVPDLKDSSWFQWVNARNEDGTYRPIMENMGSSVLSIMKKLYFHNSSAITPEWIKAYSAPFPTKQEAIGAVEFPLDVVENRITEYVVEGIKMGKLEKLRAIPAMLAEGMMDQAMPPATVMQDFKRLFPRGPIVKIAEAGHFCQEDCPETLVALIQQFIQMTD